MKKDSWNPAQYERFKAQRSAPFHDLLALVEPHGIKRAVDLGCGTGELTRVLHQRLNGAETRGLDSSPVMLAKAAAFAGPGLSFAEGRLETWQDARGVDLVFSNAALQWADDHKALLARLAASLAPGGQIAVQVPANHDHRSHALAAEIAAEAPFAAALAGYQRQPTVLRIEDYAAILHALGFEGADVSMRVYGHPLPSAHGVVEWVKGTLLTDYESRLEPDVFTAFLARYTDRLVHELGDGPYFYAFKRILFHATKG